MVAPAACPSRVPMAEHRVESCFQAQLLCMQLRVATLRTARESSPSSSSSLSNALFRTRLRLGFPLAMELLMARWMEQHPVFELPPRLLLIARLGGGCATLSVW